jgi:hypothetical protein
MEYVYLLQEREFVKSKEQIYKIGRTKQLNFARFRQYPKNSVSFFQSYCDDCVLCEHKIVKVFTKKYKKRIDIGQEYFEGNVFDMIIQISIIVQKNIQDKINNMYHEQNCIKLDNEINAEFMINLKEEIVPRKKIMECTVIEKKPTKTIIDVESAELVELVELVEPIELVEPVEPVDVKTKTGNIIIYYISILWRHIFKK